MPIRFIVASSSPNRAELFTRLGIAFETVAPTYEEVLDPAQSPEAQAREFALQKARSVYTSFSDVSDVLIVGFDSVIDFEGKTLGKASTRKEAFGMLQSFVGREQHVVTGVSLVGNLKGKPFELTEIERTRVRFRSDTTNCQIRSYLDYNDWQGKCGAYSILGTGIFLLDSIEGDFQNIIGVPVLRLSEMIRTVTGKSPYRVLEIGDRKS